MTRSIRPTSLRLLKILDDIRRLGRVRVPTDDPETWQHLREHACVRIGKSDGEFTVEITKRGIAIAEAYRLESAHDKGCTCNVCDVPF